METRAGAACAAARAARAKSGQADGALWQSYLAARRGPNVEDAPDGLYFAALAQAAAVDQLAADARAASAAAAAAGRAEQEERAALEAAREAERDAHAAWGRATAAVRELA